MTDNEADEIRLDLEALQAYREARLEFSNRVVEFNQTSERETIAALRSDATYQLAEFIFLIVSFEINTEVEFDGLIERHNEYITNLLKDRDKCQRMGLRKDRLLSSIFDGEVRPRALKIWSDENGAIDQSSMARFLVTVMSDETTRKTLVACGKAGLIERELSVFRVVLVRPNGILEGIYGDCLRTARKKIQSHG